MKKKSVSNLAQAQEKLKLALKAAEKANRAKSDFLAKMSHEIRTPLNSIIGFAELARDDDIPPKTKEYLNKIYESAEWLLVIINDILDISKIESGKMELERIPFDLHDIFSDCQEAILPKTTEKGITLFCFTEPPVGKKLIGDPVKLRQVLINILFNAVKFTNIGSVKLLSSTKEFSGKKATVYFEVKDSGIGMTMDQVTRIFDPFTQADNSITRRYGGTGLGLTIAKNILEVMGGSLEVESIPGIGSKFSFELVFDLIDDDKCQNHSINFNELDKPSFSGEVLICEDNKMNQQVIREHLERVGLKTTVTSEGEQCINQVKKRLQEGKKPFDIIFMDIHMPVMDGLETAAKIEELGVKVPIIALTANIMTDDLKRYKENGMCGYLGKPFTSQELWKCLMKYFPLMGVSSIDKSRHDIDNEKLQKQIKTYFVKTNQFIYNDIINAVTEGNIKLAHRLVHTLKSNAGQIEEVKLEQAAAEAEASLSNCVNLLTKEQCLFLETELNIVLEKLAYLLPASPSKRKYSNMDSKNIQYLLEKLEEMINNKNPECINLLEDIRGIPGSEELEAQIEDFNFKQAAVELKKLKERN